MMWVFAVLIVLAMGGVAAVAVGRGEPMAQEHADHPDVLVPAAGPLRAADLHAVRFPLVLRGYRMKDVDALLDRVAEQLPGHPHEAPQEAPHETPHETQREEPAALPARDGEPAE